MVESDPSDGVGVRGSQREAHSHGAQFFVENTKAQDEGILEPTELNLRKEYHLGELRLTNETASKFWRCTSGPKTDATWWTVIWCPEVTKRGTIFKLVLPVGFVS